VFTLAQSLAAEAAELKALRAAKRAAKRKKRRNKGCKMTGRLPYWFKYVTMILCLTYCSVMSTITLVYGIKFTLRGEKLALEQGLGDINITYFYKIDNETTNNVTGAFKMTNVSMMSFELNEYDALNRSYVTLENLATRRFGEDYNASDYDVESYANDLVMIEIPDAGGREKPYMMFGKEGTFPIPERV
jgi:hypothetical protein